MTDTDDIMSEVGTTFLLVRHLDAGSPYFIVTNKLIPALNYEKEW